MSQYFIFVTSRSFTKSQADRINAAVKQIDDTAEFVGPLAIPGSQTTGWLERPNDGSNDYSHITARNERMAAICRRELGIE